MKNLRPLLIGLGLALTLGVANYAIFSKQRIVDHGAQILLELRPTDPHSLLQGDYMALSYSPSALPPAELRDSLPRRGTAIVRLDADGVAKFARIDDGTALGNSEHRLNFKRRVYEHEVSYGADAFFFQEGQAERYAHAKFGVLRVDASGDSVLVDLAGADHKMLTPR